MTTKFRVGDKVRVIDQSGSSSYRKGEVLTVERLDRDIVICEGKRGSGMFHYRFELIDTFRIEAGKTYKTRNGWKVGPMFSVSPFDHYDSSYKFKAVDPNGDMTAWTKDGRYFAYRGDDKFDLVAEWVEPAAPAVPPTPASTSKFKVGDKVRFTSACHYGWWFGKGDTGKITRARSGSVYKWTVEVDGKGTGAVNDEHMELIEEQAGSFIVVHVKAGKLACAANPHIHATRELAEKEALRLSEAFRGQDFRVYSFDHLSTANAAPVVSPAAKLTDASIL